MALADFSSMFLRLAYAREGLEPPPGDLYSVVLSDDSGSRYREGIKIVVGGHAVPLDAPHAPS